MLSTEGWGCSIVRSCASWTSPAASRSPTRRLTALAASARGSRHSHSPAAQRSRCGASCARVLQPPTAAPVALAPLQSVPRPRQCCFLISFGPPMPQAANSRSARTNGSRVEGAESGRLSRDLPTRESACAAGAGAAAECVGPQPL